MSAKPVLRGQCVVISLLFLACPLYLPEKAQIKTEPAIYLPLGTPVSLKEHMDALSINGLATSKPVLSADSEETALFDFQGEYGETRAFIIRMKLMEENLENLLPPSPSPGTTPPNAEDPIPIDFTRISSLEGTKSGFELTEIQNILGGYDGLKFRSVPAYFYIQGPNKIFEDGEAKIFLKALNGDNPPAAPLPESGVLLPEQPANPCEFPVFPDSEDIPMTAPLSPKPETRFDLKDILNQNNPPKKLDFEYKINIKNITVKSGEIAAIREDFKTPLSAILVLVLPFQFKATKEIPILSEKNDDPDKAIHLLEEREDLFGRNSADDESEGATKDVLERMESLVIRVNIENNLGLTGYAPVYGVKPNSPDPKENLLGAIDLSGSSGIPVPKSKTGYPFNIWIEMYLEEGQNVDIKRQPEDPDVLPLKLSLAIVVITRVNETF